MMPLRLWLAVGGIVAGLAAVVWVLHFTYQAGRAAEREAVLARSIEILRERNTADDEVRNMDDAELCRALGGRWLPDESSCV